MTIDNESDPGSWAREMAARGMYECKVCGWTGNRPSITDASEEVIITSVRHRDALERAEEALDGALNALREGLSPELTAVEVREALDAIGLITGETTDEEILDRIFSKFCIGK